MKEYNDIEKLAAEYALGTLDLDERNTVASRRESEPELHSAILDWEAILVPIASQVDERVPDPALFSKIMERVSAEKSGGEFDAPLAELVARMQRSLGFWKNISVASSLVAAGLAIFAIVTVFDSSSVNSEQTYVAVFQKNDEQPAFLLSMNFDSQVLNVQSVSAVSLPEKSYQLWILEESLGETPQSLGLLDDLSAPTQKPMKQFDAEVLKAATFGISVEPPGGSVTGKPSPGAIHGFLYRLTNQSVEDNR